MAKATYLLRKASELVREKKYQDAVEVYLRATETAPSDSRAWFGLGVCLFRVGNLDVSRIALQRARHMGYPRAEEALARVEAAERHRQAEGLGAKATVAPAEADKRAAQRPAAAQGPPPRPTVRPEDEKIELVRPLRVMLVEERERERHIIARCIEGTIKDIDVVSVPYGVSTSETMSGTVHYDAAVLDWDQSPDATAGLIQILKIKRPTLFVICLTEDWDPETAVEILEAGADYHLVKNAHFASTLPLILAQWSDRDYAVVEDGAQQTEKRPDHWVDALNSIGEMFVLVDTAGTILHANPAAMKGFSRGEEQLVGQPYFEVFYGQEEPPDPCAIARALDQQEPGIGEIRDPELDRAFDLHAWPVFTRSGRLIGAVALLRGQEAAQDVGAEAEAAEKPYRDLIENVNAGIIMLRPDGALGYANPGFCRMVDLTDEELLGRPVESIVSVEDHAALAECLAAAQEHGQASERLCLQRADGSNLPAEVRVAQFADGDRTLLLMSLVGVSELERAEQELWAEANRFAGILDEGVDKLGCGVVVLDGEGCVTWVNTLAADLFGADKEGLAGRNYLDALRETLQARTDDAEGFVQTLSEAHERGESVEDRPLEISGESLRYFSTPIQTGPPSVHRLEHLYVATEVSSVPGPAIETGAAPLREVASAVPDMLFTANAEGRITWCSPSSVPVSGYSQQKLIGMPLANLSPDEERWQVEDLLRGAVTDGRRVERQEVLIVRADGQRRWVEMTLLPTGAEEAADPQAVEGILRDITDRKMTEAIRAILSGERLPSADG